MEMSGREGSRPVIVGAGNAGLAAAARLSQHGVHALLVEKETTLGGQLLLSGGAFSGAGTRRQRSRGIQDHSRLHRDEVTRIAHGLATPHLVSLATAHAATAIDWLDSLGFPFADEAPAIVLGHEPYSKPRTYWGAHNRNGARAILETLEPHIDPEIIETRLGTRLVGFTMRGVDGPVDVELLGPDGRQTVQADPLILATGGYAAAKDLLRRFQPAHSNALLGCLPHATGDAHRMLMELGVPIVGASHFLPTMGMIEDPDAPGVALPLSKARIIVDAHARAPWEIWVNTRGERWVDESGGSPDVRERALLEQPDMTWWAIWNEEVMSQAPSSVISPGWDAEKLRTQAESLDWLVRAETLPQLAELTGLPFSTLARTISEYGEASDPFGRTFRPTTLDSGPYYAVKSTGAMLLSRGGPQVDENLHPVLASGEALTKVYAIGELLGMSQFSGDAFAGGMSVGPALTFGVLVADWVAAGLP